MQNLNEKELKDLQSQGKKILVDFWAAWCRPCHMLMPILEKIESDYPDVVFGKVNVSEQTSLAQEYGVTSIPTIMIFSGTNMVQRVTGVNKEDLYRNLLNTL